MEQQTLIVQNEKNEKKANKRIFLFRLIGYLSFGLVLPMIFLIWRFNLFEKTSKLNIGGWGIVLIIFTAVFLSKLASQAVKCTDNQIIGQIVMAIKNVLIPLLAITLCLYAVGDFWKELINFFIVLTICEPIAYVLNPFPEFLKQKEKTEKEGKLVKIIGLFWDKKK